MAQIIKLLSLFKAVWDAIQWALAAYRARRTRLDEERKQRHEQALRDAENAKTADEAFDAQERIVDNGPSKP